MKISQITNIAIIGRGKVGKVFHNAFGELGLNVSSIVDPSLHQDINLYIRSVSDLPPDYDFLLISVPDGIIPKVVNDLIKAQNVKRGAIIVHTAGSISSEILQPLKDSGAYTAAWHPLQTFTGQEGLSHFRDVLFGIDGDERAVNVSSELAETLGGNVFRVPPEMRTVYHLGGVYACNFLAALISISADLMQQCGMDKERAYKALEPILSATIKNISRQGLPNAITGPLSRRDVSTVKRHLNQLKSSPLHSDIYVNLSKVLMDELKFEDKDIFTEND